MFQYASNIHCHNTRYTAKKNLYKMSVRTKVARQTINLFYSYRHLEGPSNSFKKLKFVCISKEIIHLYIYSQNNKWNTLLAWHHGFGWARNVIKACEDRESPKSSPNACVRIVPLGSECSPANQIFGNLLWESSNWLNHNLLRKTESTYQRSVNRGVVSLEYSMEKQGNFIEAWTGNGHLKSSS